MSINELYNKRMAICQECPLYLEKTKGNPICNPKLWIDSEGNVSKLPKAGFVRGCSCKISMKIKNPSAHCVANKW